MSAPFRIERSTRTSRITAAIALAVLAALLAAPWRAGRANLRLFGEFFSFIALASLWNLLAGIFGALIAAPIAPLLCRLRGACFAIGA